MNAPYTGGISACPTCNARFFHTCEGSSECARGLCPVVHHCDARKVLGSLSENPNVRENVGTAVEVFRSLWNEFVEKDTEEDVLVGPVEAVRKAPVTVDTIGTVVTENPVATKMGYCEECGRALSLTAKFCAGCGSKVMR